MVQSKEEYNARQRRYYASHKATRSAIMKRYNKKKNPKKVIKMKIRAHKAADKSSGRENNLTYDYVIELLTSQNNKCSHCDITVKLTWDVSKDPTQFSINRIKNSIGHIIGNVEITCWGCNMKYGRKH